ncbi:MAG: hypothetical protein J6336_07955 [Kiritimatiellae bacterium]|nr:hypothetical protein [Kiritimatiellia bacterium]
MRNMMRMAGTALLCGTAWMANGYELTHRWSFNGDWKEALSGIEATRIGDNIVLSNGQAVMSGNGHGQGSLDLGTNLLNTDGATVEIWATHNEVRSWSRVLDYGSDTGNYFCMAWTYGGDFTRDRAGSKMTTGEDVTEINCDSHMAPYELGVPYHIAVTFANNGDGTTTIRFSRRDVQTGALQRVGSSTIKTIASIIDPHLYLGYSFYEGDQDAHASYDEVRIWRGILDDAQLTANAILGPDTLPATMGSDSAGITLDDNTTLTIGKIGAIATDGTVTLGEGAKIVFDTAAFDGTTMRLTTGGFNLPAGMSGVLECVELTDAENYEAQVSDNNVIVTLKTAVPATAEWIGGAPASAADLENAANWFCQDANGNAMDGAIPGSVTTVIIPAGETAFTLPAGVTPAWGRIQLGANGDISQWGKIQYPQRGAINGIAWISIGLNEYVWRGPFDTPQVVIGSSDLEKSQLRLDGWFKVTAGQAGVWSLHQKVDDYFVFMIDGDWTMHNNSYAWDTYAECIVSEGWHRFTIICGDTYGGWGPSLNVNNIQTPLAVSINGAAEVAFTSDFFTFGFGENTITLTQDCDWAALGPITIDNGTVIDLKGHNLTVQEMSARHVGARIINTSSTPSILSFITDPETSDAKNNLPLGDNVTLVMEVAGVADAIWTGDGNDGDVDNPANWTCYNSRLALMAGAIPGENTAVTIRGSKVNLQAPADSPRSFRSIKLENCTLTADCDWHGFSAPVTLVGRVDLAGKKLRVSAITAEGSGAAVANGETAMAELKFDSAQLACSIVGGNIRLVKTGDGDFISPYLILGDLDEGEIVHESGHISYLNDGISRIGGYEDGHTGHGVYRMSGGTMTSDSEFTVGGFSRGEFIQTGGEVSLWNWFNIGRWNNGNGTYTITGGQLYNAYGNHVLIGSCNAVGTLNIAGNGTVSLHRPCFGGNWNGGNSKGYGTISENGRLIARQNILVGEADTCSGEVVQDGGEVTDNDLRIAENPGSVGSYTQNGGKLETQYWVYVGRGGLGSFVQTGGDNIMTAHGNDSQLHIGEIAEGTGTYTMSGGTLAVSGPAYIGNAGIGALAVSGGTVTAQCGLTLGNQAGGDGTLTLSGDGTIVANAIRKGEGVAALSIDGGTFKALENTGTFISGIPEIPVGENGFTFDTNGYAVGLDGVTLKVVSGVTTLTVTGTGTLDLSGITVDLGGDPEDSFTFAESATGGIVGIPQLAQKRYIAIRADDGTSVRIIPVGTVLFLR